MEWPAAGAVIIAMLVALSGLTVPAGAIAGFDTTDSTPAQVEEAPETAELCEGGPADPEEDVIGWEDGCWYNQSIAVDQSDGLNESELNATIGRAMARVEVIRQLEFERTVPVELQSREEYRAQRQNDSVSPALRTFDNVKFEALFLVGKDEDSIEVQNENAGTAVLGFYSSHREAIVLISENQSTLQVDELTLAHELVHALQDQHFNLSRYDARTRDGANAQSGLIEGDAKLVELRYEDRCEADGAWNDTCLSQPEGESGGGELANIGAYLMKFQPYSDGPTFITSLYRDGGWAAVNEAYEDPPTSSEQVIHPEKYRSDDPTPVHLADRQTDDWERVRPPNRPGYGTAGQAALTAMFVFPLYNPSGPARIVSPDEWLNRTDDGELSRFDPLHYDNQYTAGWDGDRLHVYQNDRNETAYVWRLVWDSPADAREFVDGYEQLLEYHGAESVGPGVWTIDEGDFAGGYKVVVEGDTVTIVNAPSVAALKEVRQGIQVTPTPTATPTTPSPTATDRQGTEGPTTSIGTEGQAGFGLLAILVTVAAVVLWHRRE